MQYVIGAGTNLGCRMRHLQAALRALNRLCGTQVIACSSVYETEPVGYREQPNFLNLVFVVESELSPSAMLGACLGVESALGRVRTFRNAPRVIDLDVLLVEEDTEQTAELTVPHPRMAERAFVMVPLQELEQAGALGRFTLPLPVFDAASQKVRLFSKKTKKTEKSA